MLFKITNNKTQSFILNQIIKFFIFYFLLLLLYYIIKNINSILLFIYKMERIMNNMKNTPARTAGILVLVSAAIYMLSSKVL